MIRACALTWECCVRSLFSGDYFYFILNQGRLTKLFWLIAEPKLLLLLSDKLFSSRKFHFTSPETSSSAIRIYKKLVQPCILPKIAESIRPFFLLSFMNKEHKCIHIREQCNVSCTVNFWCILTCMIILVN